MTATISKIEYNVPQGRYKVTKLTLATSKGEQSYSIFTNAPVHNKVVTLKVGDEVDVKMVQNGKYWNIDDIDKVRQPTSPAPTSSGPSTYQQNNERKDTAIARAVALKAGVDVFCSMIAAGMTKKTLKPEAAAEEVLAITKRFEGYCSLTEDLNDLVSDTSSLSTEEASYDEPPFPTD